MLVGDIYLGIFFSYKCLIKYDRHFAFAYLIINLFKSSYESFDIWMEWIKKYAIFPPSTSDSSRSHFRGVKTVKCQTQ